MCGVLVWIQKKNFVRILRHYGVDLEILKKSTEPLSVDIL